MSQGTGGIWEDLKQKQVNNLKRRGIHLGTRDSDRTDPSASKNLITRTGWGILPPLLRPQMRRDMKGREGERC